MASVSTTIMECRISQFRNRSKTTTFTNFTTIIDSICYILSVKKKNKKKMKKLKKNLDPHMSCIHFLSVVNGDLHRAG